MTTWLDFPLFSFIFTDRYIGKDELYRSQEAFRETHAAITWYFQNDFYGEVQTNELYIVKVRPAVHPAEHTSDARSRLDDEQYAEAELILGLVPAFMSIDLGRAIDRCLRRAWRPPNEVEVMYYRSRVARRRSWWPTAGSEGQFFFFLTFL